MKECKFIWGATNINDLPKTNLPHIVFAGKSNVGKSSLINKLCKRKSLARTSKTPGRTRQINFFNIDNQFILTDLPGYGFAKVSNNMQNNWNQLIPHYLKNTNNISLINILVDSRRGIKDHDQELIDLLISYDKKFQIIFTKHDKEKINPEIVNNIKEEINSDLLVNIIHTSCVNNIGINELRKSLYST